MTQKLHMSKSSNASQRGGHNYTAECHPHGKHTHTYAEFYIIYIFSICTGKQLQYVGHSWQLEHVKIVWIVAGHQSTLLCLKTKHWHPVYFRLTVITEMWTSYRLWTKLNTLAFTSSFLFAVSFCLSRTRWSENFVMESCYLLGLFSNQYIPHIFL